MPEAAAGCVALGLGFVCRADLGEEKGTAGRLHRTKPLPKLLQPLGAVTGGAGWPVRVAELQLGACRVRGCGHSGLPAGFSLFLGSSCKALSWGRGPAGGQEDVGWVVAVPKGGWWLLGLLQLEFILHPWITYWETI